MKVLKILLISALFLEGSSGLTARPPQKFNVPAGWMATETYGLAGRWKTPKSPFPTVDLFVRSLDKKFSIKKKEVPKFIGVVQSLRSSTLQSAGITDFKFQKFNLVDRGGKSTLIKLTGSYKVKTKVVYFKEWQHYIGKTYYQLTYTSLTPISGDTADQVLNKFQTVVKR